MPSESIGSCGTAQLPGQMDLLVAQLEIGMAVLIRYVGMPPDGCELCLMWHEHEYGSYPTIGLHWKHGSLGSAEWQYYARCERALSVLYDAIDWSELNSIWDADIEEETEDE